MPETTTRDESDADRPAAAGALVPTDPGEYDVPPGADPVRCERCGVPLPDGELLALHRALAHYEALDDGERTAYEDAYRAEQADLRAFRLRALAVLVFGYFGLVVAYAVVRAL